MHHRKPGRERGDDPRPDDPGLVSADGIIGQRRAVFIRVDDSAEGDQAELDQRLEAVADAEDQTAAHVEQIGHAVPDFRIADKGGYKLAGAVRLVAAGKTAGQEEHLRFSQTCGKTLDGSVDILGSPVVDHKDLRYRSPIGNRLRTVILTVGAGENRNQDTGLYTGDRAVTDRLRIRRQRRRRSGLGCRTARVDRFKPFLIAL